VQTPSPALVNINYFMFTNETMNTIKQLDTVNTRIDLIDNSPVQNWWENISKICIFPPRKVETIIDTIEQSLKNNCPIPIIISLCPAINNLKSPNDKGQTRELVQLTCDNQRLNLFIEELFDLNKLTFETLGVPLETMLVFADVLENGANKMFTNVDKWQEIASISAKNISQAFLNFDGDRPGEFQKTKFKVPKVRLQSNVLMQAGKANLKHEDELKKVELECLDPNTQTFDLFIKHLKLTADTPFVTTGFQTIKSAETVWNRVRFMLAQCTADGVVLPKMFKEMHKKSFKENILDPIFICSTTRLGGVELEMDAFEKSGNPSMAIFRNIGSWMKEN